MVRAFRPDPLSCVETEPILDAARRTPAAGNTWALDLVVLEGPDQTARYWDVSLPPEQRTTFPWPGLLLAPMLVVVVVDPGAYVRRYDEPDKASTGLGMGEDAWPVPYWFVDGGAAIMAILYAAVDQGLGACLFGPFEHETALRHALGVPDDRRLVGTVALGRPAPDRPSRSARRGRPEAADIVHRGHW